MASPSSDISARLLVKEQEPLAIVPNVSYNVDAEEWERMIAAEPTGLPKDGAINYDRAKQQALPVYSGACGECSSPLQLSNGEWWHADGMNDYCGGCFNTVPDEYKELYGQVRQPSDLQDEEDLYIVEGEMLRDDGSDSSSGWILACIGSSDASLSRFCLFAFFPEYVSLPVFYWLGLEHRLHTAMMLQGLFLTTSCFLQYKVYTAGVHLAAPVKLQLVYRSRSNCGTLDKLPGGVPIVWLGMKKWVFSFITAAPNYIHVLSTAVAVGASWRTWDALKDSFAARWSYVIWPIGSVVAWAGLPGILTALLVLCFALHGFGVAIGTYDVAGADPVIAAESANLLFLAKALMAKDCRAKYGGLVRLFVAPVVKVPMLWMKTSLFALSYDKMDDSSRKSMLLAILLAWYGFLPVVQGHCAYFALSKGAPFSSQVINRTPAFLLLAGLLICALHLGGIYHCESRDFSVMHGCTNVSNIMSVSNITAGSG